MRLVGEGYREEAARNLTRHITYGHVDEKVLAEMREVVDHIVGATCEEIADRLARTPIPLGGYAGAVIRDRMVQALRGEFNPLKATEGSPDAAKT